MRIILYKSTNRFSAEWRIALLAVMWLTGITQGYGQNSFKLQHRYKPDKTKVISIADATFIKKKDRKYGLSFAKLTDSSVLLLKSHKKGRDTVYPDPVWGNVRDYSFAQPVYETDTTEVMLTDIMWIKAPRFKNTTWLQPFLMFGLVAAGGVVVAPIGAAINPDEASDWLIPEAILLAATIPPILIGTSNIKYDLTKKWKLQVD